MVNHNTLYLIGYASGIAGADSHAGDGPVKVQQSPFIESIKNIEWDSMLHPDTQSGMSLDENITSLNNKLAARCSALAQRDESFCVLGGDHSCAIGTWSGVQDAIHTKGDLGLIWVDAHMDSHTPETSPSGRIHGMPLAVLLGHGDKKLTSILNDNPKLKPENVCLIGVRSFEEGEAALLKKLNVRIYFMPEVKERGFSDVLREAVAHVKKHTYAYGLTVDIDSLDPDEAPGVDVPEKGGIHAEELYQGFNMVINDPQLIATEIVEFDPGNDKDQKTEKIIAACLEIIAKAAV